MKKGGVCVKVEWGYWFCVDIGFVPLASYKQLHYVKKK
jgi:hypothetical protein